MLVPFLGWGQTYTITGRVMDINADEAIPFTNVFLKGTTVGATTDLDGYFLIQSFTKSDSVVVSAIGYAVLAKPMKDWAEQTINFGLERANINIKEIVINPGENPAHPILRNVIKNKPINDRYGLENYKYEVYTKMEVDIDNLDQGLKDRKIMRKFQFIFDGIDSTSDEKPFLPMFLTESLADYAFRADPKAQREVIKASKVSGSTNESFSQFLGSMYQEVNVYENYIMLLDKGFISPIADNALNHYRYYLTDSALFNGKWCYQLKFVPKRIGEFTFSGDFWANDTSFAVKKISMEAPKDIDINWVERVSIYQEFDQVADSTWMITKDKLVVDFAGPEKTLGFIGRKTATYKDFVINSDKNDGYFEVREDILVSDGVYEKSDSFWNIRRHEVLSKNEARIYQLIDTIRSVPIYKTWETVFVTIVTGYKKLGPVDLGPYFNLYSTNKIEGHRFSLGLRTNGALSKRFRIGGYAAYGLKDEVWKYGGDLLIIASKKPRIEIGGGYIKDINVASESDEEWGEDNILAGLYRRTVKINDSTRKAIPQKLMMQKRANGFFMKEWRLGLQVRVGFAHQTLQPYPDFDFKYLHNNRESDITDTLTSLSNAEAQFRIRFARREKFISGAVNRSSLSTKYPILNVQYAVGIPGIFESDFLYHRLDVHLSDNFPINPIGTFYYQLSVGKIFKELPYLLLEVSPGNETYFYNSYSFNLMNEFEFASDAYAQLFITHRWDGFFLNRIPGISKLNWREVVTVKAMIGKLSSANKKVNSLSTIKEAYPVPYVEVGAGIENIFRFFRVDFLWRVTHRRDVSVDPYVQNWGFRLGMQFQF